MMTCETGTRFVFAVKAESALSSLRQVVALRMWSWNPSPATLRPLSRFNKWVASSFADLINNNFVLDIGRQFTVPFASVDY
jgi:hypothetical protein